MDLRGGCVAVVHQPGLGAAAMDRHLQRVDDELGAHVLGQLPADDQPGAQVLHGDQVAAALPGLQVGQVRAPQHVGRVGPEAALIRQLLLVPDGRGGFSETRDLSRVKREERMTGSRRSRVV